MSNKTMYAAALVLNKLLADQHVPDALYPEAMAAYAGLTKELNEAAQRGEIRSATPPVHAAPPPQGSGVDALLLQAADFIESVHEGEWGSRLNRENLIAAIRTHLSAPAGAGEKE